MINSLLPPSDKFVTIWGYTVVSLGAFILGFAIYVGWKYHRGALRTGIYKGSKHVLAITISYGLLIVHLTAETVNDTHRGAPITWRLPLATVAFVLGIWALLVLVKYRALQPRD